MTWQTTGFDETGQKGFVREWSSFFHKEKPAVLFSEIQLLGGKNAVQLELNCRRCSAHTASLALVASCTCQSEKGDGLQDGG